MSLTRELPRYERRQPSEIIQALKIAHLLANPRGMELHFDDRRFMPVQVDATWFDRNKVEAGGYFVFYESGVRAFWPCELFERWHMLIEDPQ